MRIEALECHGRISQQVFVALKQKLKNLKTKRQERLESLLKLRNGLLLLLEKYIALIPVAPDLDQLRALLAKKK